MTLAIPRRDVKEPAKALITRFGNLRGILDAPLDELRKIAEEVRSKVNKWSDYIDYWALDWNLQNDTFIQGRVTYRTRKDRTLALTSDPHTFEKPGKYRILVKVVDIFGNDTSQAFDVEV